MGGRDPDGAPRPDAPGDPADGRPDPFDAADPAEYVEAMGRLKRWSGYTYRELERRARDAGDVLPRTTLTTALNRPHLPREDLLVAFVRACGVEGEAEVERWITARRRLATGKRPIGQPAPRSHGRWPPRSVLLPGAVILALLVVAGLYGLAWTSMAGRAAPGQRVPEDIPTGVGITPSSIRDGNATTYTLGDLQAIDLDSGETGDKGTVHGRDVKFQIRPSRLWTTKPTLALLDKTEQNPRACAAVPAARRQNVIREIHSLRPGRVVCVLTSEGKHAALVVVHGPSDDHSGLTFTYKIWDR